MRIRSHLLLLTAVVLVPGFFAAGIAVDKVRDGERKAGLDGLRETVRATALLVDGQVQWSLGALTALAHSPALRTGDIKTFYDEARAADRPPDVWTLLLDESGEQKFNTHFPFGTPPPPAEAHDRVAKVLSMAGPLVTDVFRGPATGKLLTTIYLAAAPSVAGRFVVAQVFAVDHWKKTALQPQGRSDWIVGVIDRQGKFISRSHLTEELLGRSARPELMAAAAAAREGLIRHSTIEGTEVYDAFTHSALTGWTVAVAAPVASIEASATQGVRWLAVGIVVALGVAAFGASFLSRLLISAMVNASAQARALGHGVQPPPPHTSHTSLDEVNELNTALIEVGQLLATERTAREAVEAQREQLLLNERAARETAQGENAAKDKFLALLGHELRNPLSAIAGATEVLAHRPGNPTAAQRFVDMIQRQNRHLRRIVDDLLETSRMLSGKIVLNSHPLELAGCVSGCVESLRSTERAAGYPLALRLEAVWVHGDGVRLEQIVNNLVTNALKFSDPASAIVVEVRAEGDWAVLEVTDSGAGISADLLPRIFEPFVQGPAPPGRQSSGLGVGLALVKQLVDLHDGTLIATSQGEGKGTKVTVKLPRIAAQETAPPRPAAKEAPAGRVLLVEDNADVRESMVELLSMMGYELAQAVDGEQALHVALEFSPDVVVMDLGLPGRSGHEIAAEFRNMPTLRHIPLIALSGYGQQRDRDKAISSGFDEHLVKPVDPDSIAEAIRRQLARCRSS